MKKRILSEAERALQTPYLDELRKRSHYFMTDLIEPPMPAPSVMDIYFLEVADKHGLDLSELDFPEEP